MTKACNTKVMVIAAGSAGHVYPAIGFCQELKDAQRGKVEIFFVTTPVFKNVPGEFSPVFLNAQRSIGGVVKLFFSAFFLIRKIRPNFVIGFGGYLTVPFLMVAMMTGKKTLLHEQNVMPGCANRFLCMWVDKVAISFPETGKYLGIFKKKAHWTRYPLRNSLRRVSREEALRFFYFRGGFFTLLVMGGSQGARHLNVQFVEALRLSKNLNRMQVIHLTGPSDYSATKKAYRGLGIQARIFEFLPEMHYAYSAADFVIGRAGAGSVFEIMSFGLPSLLVPYPLAGAHQVANARVLAEKGGAILLEDAKMTSVLLNGLLDIFIDDGIRRKAMASIVTSLFESSGNLKISDLLYL